MATEYPYAAVPDKLKEFLEKIHNRTIGIPEKVTFAWLESLGYKSSNDRSIVSVLRFIGFIDENKVPTERWKLYRGANSREVLRKAVHVAYDNLFSTYPRACEMPDATLESFFATKTTGGQQVISRLVRTFKVLCSLSDSSVTETKLEEHRSTDEKNMEKPRPISKTLRTFTPSIHIDVQIHISPEATPEQIDKIFESMAKHVFHGEG